MNLGFIIIWFYNKMNDKQIKELKARANCAEHELAKLQLEKETFEAVKSGFKDEISRLKLQIEQQERKIREFEMVVQKQNKSISDLQNSSSDSNKEQQKILEKLKNSLLEMESLVAYRASTSKKILSKILRLVNNFAQNNSEPGSSFKVNLKKFSREVVTCVEDLGKVVNSNTRVEQENDEFKETIREKDLIIDEYRVTLEKMREQMLVMRDKLKESDGKKSSDYERKYKHLSIENENLIKKVRNLEDTLREQNEFVTSLRDVFGGQGEEANLIDNELAIVDQEIQELQSSLSRALQ